jgi:hypothetical protein
MLNHRGAETQRLEGMLSLRLGASVRARAGTSGVFPTPAETEPARRRSAIGGTNRA